jgi:hypothetical protein
MGKVRAGTGVGSLVTAWVLGAPIGVMVLIAITSVIICFLKMDPDLVDAFGRWKRKPEESLGRGGREGWTRALPPPKPSAPPQESKNSHASTRNPQGRRGRRDRPHTQGHAQGTNGRGKRRKHREPRLR